MKKDFFTEHIKYIDSFNEQDKNSIQADLSNYDYIFDCSTDDDLMYILNNLEILPTILNLSINNHAKALVCGISPNLYRFVRHQFNLILKDNAQDLYNPTGCWNPTFKASYNDIAILVQFALKHINIMVKGNSLENFVVKYIDEEQVLQVETY